MKRGKDEERVTGPMFPRLHVNDTEKGGPRAPPRNKMALYEQLSIPSQRFNSVYNTSTGAPPVSSTQENDNKRATIFPRHLSLSTPPTDNSNVAPSDYNTSLAVSQKKLDEDDYAVPVFVQPENGQNCNNSHCRDQGILSLSSPAPISHSVRNQSSSTFSNLRQKDSSQIEKTQFPPKQTHPSEYQEEGDCLRTNMDRLQNTNYGLHHKFTDGFQLQSVREHELDRENGDVCDDDSDTSVVDSISGVDICPDDVVGIIGQKHFWKARRAIVNQQRVFAVQLFELHRLIKVQKSFAGSPNLLLENAAACLGKPPKVPSTKELSVEIIVNSSPNIEKHKEDIKNHSHKLEGSAESAVEKTSLSSLQNTSNHPGNNHFPFPTNPTQIPLTTNPNTGPCYPNQSMGHHWLVPIMSPTEGLIYKPYPGHTGSNPIMNNFPNPSYGIPNTHPYFQGFGIPPGFPSMSHAYFPPYNMPVVGPSVSGSAVDQANHFTGQQQNSYNVPAQKKSKPNTPNFVNTRMCIENDLQASTASSPSDGRKGLQLFPASASAADYEDAENRTRVIKVVPHNAISANESAFRIFQSIQKERERYELL